MKLLLERAGTIEWEIIGLFDSYDDINQWMEDQWDISYEQWVEEAKENIFELGNSDWDATREDWYDENEVRVREIPER